MPPARTASLAESDAPRTYAARRRRWPRRLLAITAGALLALAAMEIVLRLTADRDRFCPHQPDSIRRGGPADPARTPGVFGYAYFSTNSFGCRGPEPDGQRHRLLAVGGSTT